MSVWAGLLLSCLAFPASDDLYRFLISQPSLRRIESTVREISVCGSRLAGSPGEEAALSYAEKCLRALGLRTRRERFDVSVPETVGAAEMRVGGRAWKLLPLWPNLVRTSTCDVTGPLIDGGDGSLEALNGQEIRGAVVVLNFDCGNRWKNAARLGAVAIVFRWPKEVSRAEAEAKFSATPLDVPRFLLPSGFTSSAPGRAGQSAAGSAHSKVASVVRIVCRQDWVARRSSNLIAELPGTDPALADEPIVLWAYADSMSASPDLAPGAEQAGGLIGLLELAEILARGDHRRPVEFVVSGAHCLGLQGAREFIDRRIESNGFKPLLVCTLDLSTGSAALGEFGRGYAYNYRDEILDSVLPVCRVLRRHAEKLTPLLGETLPRVVLTDAANHSDNRSWKNNIAATFAFDCEPFMSAGYSAITFATVDDARPHVDTPSDSFDRMNLANLRRQLQILTVIMHHVVNDPVAQTGDDALPLHPPSPSRISLIGGFATATGYVAQYDPAKSLVPDLRIPGSLAVRVSNKKTMMGVRGNEIQLTSGPEARYRFLGLPPLTDYATLFKPDTVIVAYHLDGSTGEIDYAPDQGPFGAQAFPTLIGLKTSLRSSPIVLFPCVGANLYGLVDPQELSPFLNWTILDPVGGGEPRHYGFAQAGFDVTTPWESDDTAVLFLPPGQRFQLLMGRSLGENRLILTGSTPTNEAGQGYEIAQAQPGPPIQGPKTATPQAPDGSTPNTQHPTPPYPKGPKATTPQGPSLPTPNTQHQAPPFPQGPNTSTPQYPNTPPPAGDLTLLAAKDLTAINQGRLDKFAKYRIVGSYVSDLHEQAMAELKQAEEAQAKLDWGGEIRHARAAWGLALRVHPILQNTANDVVNGVIFYAFLLIPFSYFSERLFFASKHLARQIFVSVGIFVAAFATLRLVHPAFDLVANPPMIFVGFIMGALSLIVTAFVVGKFEGALRSVKQAESGVRELDVRRSNVAMAAFSLGISNLRRRKARTFLTTLTLVVVTFIVLSFTSIVPALQLNQMPSNAQARYGGILLRDPGLEELRMSAYDALSNEFSGRAKVVRRVYSHDVEHPGEAAMSIQKGNLWADASAMEGLDPDELLLTRPQDALLPGGSWFSEGDRRQIILPVPIAEKLGTHLHDKVRFMGSDYAVVGIFDPAAMKAVVDLDGESIIPPDYGVSQQDQKMSGSKTRAFRKFVRLDPSVCFFLPAQTALDLGGDLRSVAVGFSNPKEVPAAMASLMPRLRLNLYASVPAPGGKGLEVRQFSVLQGSKSTGLALVLVQLGIAAVFVLNTMIASVFERTREISIFSAIGLAPNHISTLFFAESLVYGVLGVVLGYFGAQGVAKAIVTTGAYPQLTLNFSSTSAIMSAMLVIGVVVASTIYPARKAAQIAAPAMAEQAFDTEPEGDVWTLPLPFSVSAADAGPIVAFLADWFRAYEEYTIGAFVTTGTRLDSQPDPPSHRVTSTAWLAPYDLGVSQELVIEATPATVPDTYSLRLMLRRLEGEPRNWVTLNRRFLTSLRRQFLRWRTLSDEERELFARKST